MSHSDRSPTDRLPEELLAYLFTLATHDGHTQNNLPFDPYNIQMPLILSTALWTNICVTWQLEVAVDATEESPLAPELTVQHVNMFLARSRHHPLNILIDARDPDWDFSESESE
jgi:hypothetical protein